MSAQSLIAAIQSADVALLRAEVESLQARYPQRRGLLESNPINATFGSLELTALHVAVRAYAVHRDDERLAVVFDEMVQTLLDADANPAMEIGIKRDWRWLLGRRVWVVVEAGQTVAQVCDRHLPPSLARWFERTAGEFNHNTGILRGNETRELLSNAMKQSWQKRQNKVMEEASA